MIFLKKGKFIFVVFLIISLNTFSQKLVVKDLNEGFIIPNVTIYNTKKTTTIISDFNGYLNLSEFKKSDTITFSHVAYEKLQIPVNKILQSDKDVYDVYLSPSTQTLSEIILSVGRNRGSKEKISKKVSLITAKKTELWWRC